MGILSKNNTKVKFSRYSRHAVAEIKETKSLNLITEDLIARTLKSLGLVDDTNYDLFKCVCKIVTLMYNDNILQRSRQVSSDISDTNFTIDINQISLEPCEYSPICDSQVFSGVLVPYKDVLFNDYITTFHKTNVKILLVNTIAYGDNFKRSGQKTPGIDIKEIIKYDQMENMRLDDEETDIQYDMIKVFELLREMNISVIFYRGELSDNICEYCERFNIILIHVENYEVLHRISIVTSAEILFGLKPNNNESFSDGQVKTAVLTFIPTLALDKLAILKNRKKLSYCNSSIVYGYIQIHNCSTRIDSELFIDNERTLDMFLYTILVSGRSSDLQHLKLELLTECLKKVEYFLKSKCFCLKDDSSTAVEKNGSILKEIKRKEQISQESYRENYITPVWMEFDVKLFRSVICEEMAILFECFHKMINRNSISLHDKDSAIEMDVMFQTKLWQESLYCVIRICCTLKCSNELFG